ncbi:helix-turn-helix domain-containing protein [Paenibacillus sp. FSL P4-0288]|uniref:helix-turn-helix domain-containing protein n=1 Tax=Paenibacillus sp. FSL P4-0288 TaxID=2921633 RepID=UPI0030FBE998
MTTESLYKHLDKLRLQKGWTQEEFAMNTGYSTSHISKILRGHHIITPRFVKQVCILFNLSRYSVLVSLHRNEHYVKLGSDVRGEVIPEAEAIRAIESRDYEFTTFWGSFLDFRYQDEDHHWQFKDLSDFSTETGIGEKRLEEIFDCYFEPCEPVTIEETIRVCKALNKRWHELFALTCNDIHDHNIVNVAVTFDRYVEQQKSKSTDRFQQLPVEKLSEDEVSFLLEMLKSYRKLHLAPVPQ